MCYVVCVLCCVCVCVCVVCVCVCVLCVCAYINSMGPISATSPPYIKGKVLFHWIPSNNLWLFHHQEGTAQIRCTFPFTAQLDEVYATVQSQFKIHSFSILNTPQGRDLGQLNKASSWTAVLALFS